MLQQIFRPFAFLAIRHPSAKVYMLTWGWPICITVLVYAVIHCAGLRLNVYGETGLIAKILAFVQSLPGFYLAALAAVATFNNPGMDKLMPGNPPTAQVLHNGVLTEIKLSRRRFLSMMFAFLTAISFVVTLMAIFALNVADPIKSIANIQFVKFLHHFFLSAFMFLMWQMIVVTIWGLFYLGERVHTPD